MEKKRDTPPVGTSKSEEVPGGYVDCHGATPPPEGLYEHDFIAEKISSFTSVKNSDIAHFHKHGYIAIDGAFAEEETASALAGFIHLASGKISGYNRIQYEAMSREHIEQLTEKERPEVVRKLGSFVELEPRLHALAHHPKLTTLLQRLTGSREVTMFQDMALSKPPKIGREKPWHQDCAYFNVNPFTSVVGVWIALDDATVENGCMHVLDQGHKEGPQNHFLRRDWQICDTDVERLHHSRLKVAAIPLRAGGCMLFSGLLPHGSPPNQTAKRRRALQFHYYPARTEQTTDEDRMAIYGGEGKGIEC